MLDGDVGCVLTEDGPVVLEINTRLGDSEAQVVLPGVHTNFTDVCLSVLHQRLDSVKLDLDPLVRCCVAATQGPVPGGSRPGWPYGAYPCGQPIHGLDAIDPARATVFFAGTGLDAEGRPVTNGGRVLHVVGAETTLAGAVDNAYSQLARISFVGLRYRTDIGRSTARREDQDHYL